MINLKKIYWHIIDFFNTLRPHCPFCESGEVRRIEDSGEYICEDCEYIF